MEDLIQIQKVLGTVQGTPFKLVSLEGGKDRRLIKTGELNCLTERKIFTLGPMAKKKYYCFLFNDLFLLTDFSENKGTHCVRHVGLVHKLRESERDLKLGYRKMFSAAEAPKNVCTKYLIVDCTFSCSGSDVANESEIVDAIRHQLVSTNDLSLYPVQGDSYWMYSIQTKAFISPKCLSYSYFITAILISFG